MSPMIPQLRVPILLFLFAAALHAEDRATLRIDGRAVDADGQPVAGARVELRPVLSRYEMGVREADGMGESPPEAEAASGADGGFSLAAPRSGMWTVTARIPPVSPLHNSPPAVP